MTSLRHPCRASLALTLTLLVATASFSAGSATKSGTSSAAVPAKPAKSAHAKKDSGAESPLPDYHPPDAFSVDFVIQTGDQNITMNRHIDHGRIRSEVSMGDDRKIVMIETGDKDGTTYTLMPEDQRAMKMTRAAAEKFSGIDAKAAAMDSVTPATLPPGTKIVYVGEEKLGDQPAKKYTMTSEAGDGLMWFDASSGAPLRMEGEYEGKKSVVEWKNYQVEPQKAELFEIPKSYDVMDMDAMMAQMGSGGGKLGQLAGMASGMGGMGGMGATGAMAKGMVGGMAQSMGESMGSSFGSSLGAALGGPLGAMAGQYLGGKIGGYLGKKATGN
jgi:hypothetical protein